MSVYIELVTFQDHIYIYTALADQVEAVITLEGQENSTSPMLCVLHLHFKMWEEKEVIS